MAANPLDQIIQYDAAKGRSVVTFAGVDVPRGLCKKIVKQLAVDRPSWVQVICQRAIPGSAFSRALAGQSLPSVKDFVFDTHNQTISRQYNNSLGDLGDVLTALTQVERVFATGSSTLHAVTHATLCELFLLGSPPAADALKGLGASTLPALQTFGLELGDLSSAPAEVAVRALATLKAPKLRSVHIKGVLVVETFLGLIAGIVPGTWSTLWLDGAVHDEDVLLDVLKAHAPALRGLAALALPLSQIAKESIAEVKAVLPAVVDCDHLRCPLRPQNYLSW